MSLIEVRNSSLFIISIECTSDNCSCIKRICFGKIHYGEKSFFVCKPMGGSLIAVAH